MTEDRALYPPQNPISVGLAGRCPRCGQGRIFAGFLTVAPSCRACGLDLGFADSADGPAVFVITEIAYSPPIWVHLLLWLPLVLVLCLGMLRPLKGVLIALQHHHRAEEGRLHRAD